MDLLTAKRIIADNYAGEENSLCYLLHEECQFSTAAFWEYYDAISCVTRNAVKEDVLSAQIAVGYQSFLKEIIWHFDPKDSAVMESFPENYTDYIERLDFAVRAYFENKPQWLEDALFELQKSMKNQETIQDIEDKMNRHMARRERVDLKAIYGHLKDRYPLVLTDTFALENGEKDFGENLEILLGESAAGKFQLYDNGLDIVFEVDRPDGSYTHWHPGNTAEAMADVEEFMEGKRKNE